MSFALLYWILMLIWAIFSVRTNWQPAGAPNRFAPLGGTLFQFVLFCLIGWRIFGPPVHP